MSIIHEGPSFDVPAEEAVDPSWVDETPDNPLAKKREQHPARKRRTEDAELKAMKRIAALPSGGALPWLYGIRRIGHVAGARADCFLILAGGGVGSGVARFSIGDARRGPGDTHG